MRTRGSVNVDSEKVNHDKEVLHNSGDGDMNPAAAKNSNNSPRKRKIPSPVTPSPLTGRKYLLRSAGGGVRDLPSTFSAQIKTQAVPVATPVNPVTERRKQRKYLLESAGDGVRVLRSTVNAQIKSQAVPVATPVNPVTKRRKQSEYLLRSAGDGVRVLRSTVNAQIKTQAVPVATPVNPVTERRKQRKLKNSTTDEYSMARRKIRYLLNRMQYEQNMIDAYAGEGWKGQSAEKIRPEKELERAESEILRCKMKIRDLFRHLDSLSSEGRFQESLFDDEGQISSEDIFCSRCGKTDLSADNDIILCDGICVRGFHQKCLNPPLLSADIPVGDEGWLCPACVCKVDCIALLNECQGSTISIENTWEKVFPEAAAIANGNKQSDDFPSDDSEDYEYDPNRPEDKKDHEEESESEESDHEEESESEDSDFTPSAENSDASERPKQNENSGLSTDDSEDDDSDSDVPDPNKISQKDVSSSDESDFTSDSDEFCKELSKTFGANEDTAYSLRKNERPAEDANHSSLNSDLLSSLDKDMNEENILVSGKRKMNILDYKDPYDETYGKSLSDSSEDEDWHESSEMGMPKRRKKDGVREGSHILPKANARNIKKKGSLRNDAGELTEAEAVSNIFNGQLQESQLDGEVTPVRTHSKADSYTIEAGEEHPVFHETGSNVSESSNSIYRRLGSISSQKLYECFQENQYPTRDKKECLAQELGLTIRQVDKWFSNTRHSYRVSAEEVSQAPNKDNESTEMRKSDSDKIVVGQSSSTKGKGVMLAPTSELRAEHVSNLAEGLSESSSPNEGKGRKSEAEAEKWSVHHNAYVGSPSSKEGKGKKLATAGRSRVAEENLRKDVDVDRQKAIARELRKMKQRR